MAVASVFVIEDNHNHDHYHPQRRAQSLSSIGFTPAFALSQKPCSVGSGSAGAWMENQWRWALDAHFGENSQR
jgi:hypothetical protein